MGIEAGFMVLPPLLIVHEVGRGEDKKNSVYNRRLARSNGGAGKGCLSGKGALLNEVK